MSKHSQFEHVFDKLKPILGEYADKLACVTDKPGEFYLDTRHVMPNKKRLFFGAVQIKKRYVSYHLMPVYVFPDLLSSMSEDLKRRMQGKSCFNFTSADDQMLSELAELTKTGYQRYQEAGYV